MTAIETITYPCPVNHYSFDLSCAGGRKAYAELQAELAGLGLRCFEVLAEPLATRKVPELVHLEAEHLFERQANTAEGVRVFDWYQGVYPNAKIKEGYWLEIPEAFSELRNLTYGCGYCGKQEPQPDEAFCHRCLGSKYLKESELYLLRFVSMAEPFSRHREPLTEAEAAELGELYHAAQLEGTKTRGERSRAKQRAKVAADLAKAERKAEGLTWLLDRELSTADVLFYDHRDVFSWGWHTLLCPTVADALVQELAEFPFHFELKAEGFTYDSLEGKA